MKQTKFVSVEKSRASEGWMMEKKLRKIWAVSLLTLSCASLVVAISNIASYKLPDAFKWIILAVDLVAVPVMVYSSVKLKIWKKSADGSVNLEK